MLIKKATIKDATYIVKLLAPKWFSSEKEAVAYCAIRVKQKEALVAVDDNKIIGTLLFIRNYSHDANYAEYLMVAEDARRKGIARFLFAEFFKICKREQPSKQPYALSSTDSKNKISIAMHQKIGFVILGRIKKLHYGRSEIMFGYKLR